MDPRLCRVALGLALALGGCAESVRPATERAQARARSTRRHETGVYLAAMEGGGGAAVRYAHPVWLSDHWLAGQLNVRFEVLTGMQRATFGRFVAVGGFTFGGHLFLTSWFSMELRLGLATGFTAGSGGGAVLLGLLGGGGYVFHPFRDHRVRFKLDLLLSPMGALTSRPTDCPLCNGLLGLGVAFEAPL